jgi:transposase
MNTASACNRCGGGSGRQSANGLLPWCNTASPGAPVVGFVHPASGRPFFHLATTLSIPVFEVALAEFARQAGASPTKQIVLVLDRAGGHTSLTLRVPDHVHVLCLPPYSPELQPAEHVWPLTNAVLVNRHFATIEELEDAHFAHCAALQRQRDRIRSTTCFHWWPKQIHKRRGPKRT